MTKEQKIDFEILDMNKMLDYIPGHVYWKDKHGTILGCNLTQAQSSGVNNISEIIGKNNFDLMPPEEAAVVQANDQLVMRYGKLLIMEEIAELQGKKRTFLSHKVPIKNSLGQPVGILGISMDITHQKELEEQLIKSNRALKKALARQKALEAELIDKNQQLEEALRNLK